MGDEDIINLLLLFGADTKVTPKSNPKDVYEYASEPVMPSIKRIINEYNTRLLQITDMVMKNCLSGVKASIYSPQLCRCISPAEKSINEFYFNCQQKAGEKGKQFKSVDLASISLIAMF